MSSRRKPLDDARKRLKEKLGAMDEQVNFIHNSVNQITSGVQATAQQLLNETNKTKFFSKYRNVSQELEKCLDDLLLVSAAISSLDDQDEEDEDEEDGEGDDGDSQVESERVCGAVVKTEQPLGDAPFPKSSVPKSPNGQVGGREKTTQVESEVSQPPAPNQADDYSTSEVSSTTTMQAVMVESKPSMDNLSSTDSCKSKVFSEEVDLAKAIHINGTSKNQERRMSCEEGKTKIKLVETEQQKSNTSQQSCTLERQQDVCDNNSNTLSFSKLGKEERISPTELFAGDLLEKGLRTVSPTKEVLGLPIPSFKFPGKGYVQVSVNEIKSPCEFWIQQSTDDLDCLLEEMCVFFLKCAKNGDKGGMSSLPTAGDVCCGKFTGDHMWYRAWVSQVFPDSSLAEVIYVDEGNKECLPPSKLRPLDKKFRKLPCQAMRCTLGGIKLIDDEDKKVNDWFRRRLSGETLVAVLDEDNRYTPPGTPVPIHLYIRPYGANTVESIESLQLEYSLNDMMLREGLAEPLLPTDHNLADNNSVTLDSGMQSGTNSRLSSLSSDAGFHETSPTKGGGLDKSSRRRGSDAGRKSNEVGQLGDNTGRHDETGNARRDNGQHGDGTRENDGYLGDDVCVPPPAIPLDSDGSVYLLVSFVVNPGEFYVHFITNDSGQLDTMMTRMNEIYKDETFQKKHSTQTPFSPRIGVFCCAKFSADGNWYRAVVLQVRHTMSETERLDEARSTILVEVFYVDFGNTECVPVEDLRYLLPEFRQLSIQAVKCSLANIQAASTGDELDDDVFDTKSGSNHSNPSQRPKAKSFPRARSPLLARRKRPTVAQYDNAISRAGGDEDDDEDDELLEFPLSFKVPKMNTRSDIKKNQRRLTVVSDTAVELFEKVWSKNSEPRRSPPWSTEASEFFRGLTSSAVKMIGFVVPWDSQMLNSIVNYSQVADCSLPNLGPVLNLNLYDVSGEIDVFINAALVLTGHAVSSVDTSNDGNKKIIPPSNVPVVKMNEKDLNRVAKALPDPTLSQSPVSPLSPTDELMDRWNPMHKDYESYRNSYHVPTDNVQVAITGYEEDRGKICQFYNTKYGCFKGDKCPDVHTDQDLKGKICIYGINEEICVSLPEIGTWVAARISAMYNPNHFWLQLPFGREPLDKQLTKNRSGKETSGEENAKELDGLIKDMREFYSNSLRRGRSIVPVEKGELVVLKYEKDKEYYRALIKQEKEGKYEASFIDYGFSDWVRRNDVFPIIPQFLHLPFQAIECFLPNIKPNSEVNGSSLWSQDAKRHFESLVANKLVVCYVLSTAAGNTMSVNLFDSTKGMNLSSEMVKSGYAKYRSNISSQADKSCVFSQFAA